MRLSEAPEQLRPYVFHGVEIQLSGKEAIGTCPFCGREKKFSIRIEDGRWRCFVCNVGEDTGKMVKGGNVNTFLRLLWEESRTNTSIDDYSALGTERGLEVETLQEWGVVRSSLSNHWLVPGYDLTNKLRQLYKYAKNKEGKRQLYATPGIPHFLHGAEINTLHKEEVYIAEGPWDGMALWESMRSVTRNGKGLVPTKRQRVSLLSNAAVIAVPGSGVFVEEWSSLLADKTVRLMYDNDHPRRLCQKCKTSWHITEYEECPTCNIPLNGKEIPPAGYSSLQRVTKILSKASTQPKRVEYLFWGEKGYDETLKSGYDVRDALGSDDRKRPELLDALLKRTKPIPTEWAEGGSNGDGSVVTELIPCREWSKLVMEWRKAMQWIDGLDRVLSIILASITSTDNSGNPLWLKIISPPSTGKSTLAEAVSMARQYVFPKSTLRGFHSGFKTDGKGEEDHGLIPKIRNKTFVVKDGDTILKLPNRSQVFSEARDLYDGTARVHYRNKIDRNHENVRFTWLLFGTESLREIDENDLGERFLTTRIMEAIDEELEYDILLRTIHGEDRLLGSDETEKANRPELQRAMQMTGGYVEYLRKNARVLLSQVETPMTAKIRLAKYAAFIAFMRARPSKTQDETAERELAARLASQLMRLAKCLAVVLNLKEVDDEVMRRVRSVTMDSARGIGFDIATQLYKAGERGYETKTIAANTRNTDEKTRKHLQFLSRIDGVVLFQHKIATGLMSKKMWRMTNRLYRLYEEVMGEKEGDSA